MTKAILHLSPAAKVDLQEIWLYSSATWDKEQADKYVTGLKQVCYQLTELSSLGKSVSAIRADIRSYRYQRHYIIYIKETERVVFLAFIHEKRDTLRHVLSRLPQIN